jgi:ribosomal protein S14
MVRFRKNSGPLKKKKESYRLKSRCSSTLRGRAYGRQFALSRWELFKIYAKGSVFNLVTKLLFNFKFKKKVFLSSYIKKNKSSPLLVGVSQNTFVGFIESSGTTNRVSQAGAAQGRLGSLKYRLDLFLKLLIPVSKFLVFKKKAPSAGVFFFSFILWPGEFLDLLALVLYANPVFLNTKYFDTSAFLKSKRRGLSLVLYYIFKVPLFSTWLVVFVETGDAARSSGSPRVLSIETLFRGASWAERELSELFGFFFFFKSNNRKLITDYFFKVYPLLKWVPSIGFSEIYVSAEGFFFLRPVKVFNASLS